MKPQDFDAPDLTAYALGELSAQEAAKVRQLLAESPQARAELERIQQMVAALNQAPPVPVRALLPHQRETVLSMGRPAAAPHPSKVVPFARPGGSARSSARVATGNPWRVTKYAAAAALMAGAFVLGQQTAGKLNLSGLLEGSSKSKAGTPDVAATSAPVEGTATAAPPTEVPEVAPVPKGPVPMTVAAEVPGSRKFELPGKLSGVSARGAEPPKAPAPPAAPAPLVASTPSLKGFASTAATTESRLPIAPKLLRRPPLPKEFAGVVLASPQPPNAKPDAPRKPDPQPALVIHSWKAEIASCPWDPSRRLMRLVAQVPVEQNGVQHQDAEYKLVAKFDPFHVQGFRLVGERHMAPTAAGTQATRFAWYEIIPNRNFNATQDRPVTLGTITIEQPKGAHAVPELAPLKIVDRGGGWADAREDFVFETAMVGWSMLLQGADNIGGLNCKMVLDLAERNSGEDSKGERAKFINVVKQAQRAVGL